jgi:hypothetical protein
MHAVGGGGGGGGAESPLLFIELLNYSFIFF